MFDFTKFLTDYYAIAAAAVMLVAMIYLCIYYGLYHFRIGRWHLKNKKSKDLNSDSLSPSASLPSVSVVLTAHNDGKWLQENLIYLLEQDYPSFEVVVVDYLSTDNTKYVLQTLSKYYPILKIVPFPEDVNLFQGKKYPLSIGIKSAKNDILMLADPDCTTNNPLWLRGMVKGYANNQTKIVLGYCGIKRSNNLLGWMQQYDAILYGTHYLGSALLGHPYTGSGRNLSYRRSFFFERGAFISHYDVADGSDDLFVYQNSTRSNTSISIDTDACLTIEPRKTFSAWHNDRIHRIGTRNRHSIVSRIVESLPDIALLLFYASAAFLIAGGSMPWLIVVILLILKMAWQIVAFASPSKRFDGGLVYLAAPLFEIYFSIANNILKLFPLHNNKRFKA